jgi:hypothetical protein
MPSAVIRGSTDFEDFWCHILVKVSYSIALCHIYFISQMAILGHFLHFFQLFMFQSVTLCQSVTYVMDVTLVTYVTLINILM